ncbi:hypothetical protein LT85_0747 [Collimonas arenae]|uniref:Uncharacterized protein n=1 Tax=Collimonas arenae TaxID=279058 RepID=A0A0A1FAL1_9BURK|nr:hypothetical protein [Collimonas arenae]AIY39907.1 hypothetical protein LT85_0747 [Collimonas arenae]
MSDKQLKQKSVAVINAALKLYRGPAYVSPPKKVVGYADYQKLTRHQIDQGVISLVHACNLSGGSVEDMDLYKLVRTYLWHREARAEINAVVRRYGL